MSKQEKKETRKNSIQKIINCNIRLLEQRKALNFDKAIKNFIDQNIKLLEEYKQDKNKLYSL